MKRRLVTTAALLIAGFVIQWGLAWGLAWAVPMSGFVATHTRSVGGSRRPDPERLNTFDALHVDTTRVFGSTRRVWYSSRLTWNFNYNRARIDPNGQGEPPNITWPDCGPIKWGNLPDAIDEFREGADEGTIGGGAEEARGWPLRCLWVEYGNAADVYLGQSGITTVEGGFIVKLDQTYSAQQTPSNWLSPRPAGSLDIGDVRAIPYRPIWSGIAFNMLFYALLLWLLLSVWRILKGRRRMSCGRCPKCAYDLRRDLRAGCPECGWARHGAEGANA